MGDRTGISWTDSTWNPTVGCSRVSPGCDHCYAMLQAPRQADRGPYEGVVSGGDWTGRVNYAPDRLDQPLRWRRPRHIFVNSMSDLFHPELLKLERDPYPPLAEIVAVMVAADWHRFQVLTKRPQLMDRVLRTPMFKLDVNAILLKRGHPVMPGGMSEPDTPWPKHIAWGTSIESSQFAFRARHVQSTPAGERFISFEPLLGPMPDDLDLSGIDGAIIGGESGRDARPMEEWWARELIELCHAQGVAVHFKQAGKVLGERWGCSDSHGADRLAWPEWAQVREWPRSAA